MAASSHPKMKGEKSDYEAFLGGVGTSQKKVVDPRGRAERRHEKGPDEDPGGPGDVAFTRVDVLLCVGRGNRLA